MLEVASPHVQISIRLLDRDVTILNVDHAEKLMHTAAGSNHAAKMLPYFATCLFAGLRPFEAMRLDWARIRFEDGRIEILKDTTKMKRRRWARIEANGLEWLKTYANESGPIVGGISSMTWKRHFNAIRMDAGLIPNPKDERPADHRIWDQDIMRHSFASYWLATCKNAPPLSEIMGNSVPIIRKHYENTVLEDVATGFWAIRPG